MAYQEALNKAWLELAKINSQEIYPLKFLADEYSIDIKEKSVISLSCNTPAQEHVKILLLHYLIKSIESLPKLTGSWISFQELDGGKGYYPTFKKRVIEPIIRKYAKSPEGILNLVERFSAKRIQIADYSVTLEAFAGIPVLITFWKSDEEFSAEANMLFDSSIKEVFPTEDIVVMAELVAKNI